MDKRLGGDQFMRIEIPQNKVSHDYEKVLDEFVSFLKSRLGESLLMVYLTGSYARGDANDTSDLDVFCIFSNINQYILETVGFCARNTSVSYDVLEIFSCELGSISFILSIAFSIPLSCLNVEYNSSIL